MNGHVERINQLFYEDIKSKNNLDSGHTLQLNSEKLFEKTSKNILEIVSEILSIDKENIELDVENSDYGFDSISTTDFINRVNEKYNLELTPPIFFEYSTLGSFIQYLLDKHLDQIIKVYGNSCKLVTPEVEATNASEVNESLLKNKYGENQNRDEPVAIIGMAGIMPQSDSLQEFWANLELQKDLITEIPEDRWDWREYFGDPVNAANKTRIKWGGFMKNVDKFDPLFFGISPREAENMDPRQRICLKTVWETIEDAGYKASDLSGTKTGLFVGVGSSDYYDLLNQYGIDIQAQTATGVFNSILVNRISYILNIHGPSEPVDTACSASLVAIHRAVESIRSGESDMAIAGGVNVMVSPNLYITLNKSGMLCEDGRCKTFDKSANGYVRGEGCGSIMLKSLSKAQLDGDNIYGVIKGTAVNHGGHANSLTAPNPNAQADLIVDAWRKSGIDPATVSYIETHGTGTSLGDPIEINGIKKAFDHLYEKWGKTSAEYPHCGLGSVKTYIGHLEAAAGVAGVLKVLLSMKYKKIHGNLHFNELNPYIELESSPLYIISKTHKWEKIDNDIPRRAGVSSFGFGGVNAHVLIEEYEHLPRKVNMSNQPQVIILSARNEERLKEYAKKMADFLEKTDADFVDIAYTLQCGREAMEERLAFVASSIHEAKEILSQYCQGKTDIHNLYLGNLKKRKSMLGFLVEGKDGEEFFEILIKNKKLNKIAQIWVWGMEANWELNYSTYRPRRISLPTYPFADERYWISTYGKNLSAQSDKDSKDFKFHPLLHKNTSDFSEQRFSSIFTGQEFFFSDHVVNGKKVLPAVAYLEMVREGVKQASGSLGPNQIVSLKDITWASPIRVEQVPVKVHIGLHPKDNGEINFQVYSNAGEEVAHSVGNAIISNIIEFPTLDLNVLQTQCNQNTVEGIQCYKIFKAMGVEYGPACQGIESIFIGQDQVLAKLALPSNVSYSINQYILHPSLMDSALQASVVLSLGQNIGGAGSKIPNKPVLPFAIEELQVIRSCSSAMWALIRYSKDSETGDKLQKFDIDLCDDAGRICVRIKGYTSRILDEEIDLAPVEKNIDTIMFEPFFKEIVVDSETLESSYIEHIVVLCEHGKDIKIEIEGVRCIILRSHNSSIDQRFKNYALQIFDEIQRIIKNKPKGRVLIQIVVPSKGEQQLFSGLSGILKTAQIENPRLIGQLIEVELGEDSENLIDKLMENKQCPNDNYIRYEEGRRWIRGLKEIEISQEEISIPWKEQGIYLITGGMGGLGLLFAREIASKANEVILILTGRSPLSQIKKDKLKELESLGAIVEYRKTDVAQKKEVDGLIQGIKEKYGSINGIIHSAGMIKDNFILKKTEEEIQEVLAPKVSGVVNLDYASKDLNLDFFIFFSSVAGSMGNSGQADYSMANAFMDSYARYRTELVLSKKRHGKTLAINWPLWKEGGMNVDEETKKMMNGIGIKSLETSAGIKLLYKALLSNRYQVMAMQGDLAKLRQFAGIDLEEYQTDNKGYLEIVEKISKGEISKNQLIELLKDAKG